MDYQLRCEEKIGAEFQGYVTLRERNLFRMCTIMTMFTEMTIIARLLMIMIIVVMMTMTISMMMMMVVNKDDDERNGDGRDDAKRKDEADFYPIVLQVSQSSCVSLSSLSSITGIPSGSTSQANSVKRL